MRWAGPKARSKALAGADATRWRPCGRHLYYHLLQSVARTTQSPALSLVQFFRAARRAASRSLRQAEPACLPSSVNASAPHIFGPILVIATVVGCIFGGIAGFETGGIGGAILGFILGGLGALLVVGILLGVLAAIAEGPPIYLAIFSPAIVLIVVVAAAIVLWGVGGP